MRRLTVTSLASVIGAGMLIASAGTAMAQRMAPPGSAYQKVSALVPLPDFIPGLGTLYVDPGTLPVGPFLAYDHQGALVSSIYMIPLKDMNAQKSFSDLKVARERADRVDIVFNAGHPGVTEPHYHMIVWYVPPEHAAKLSK